MTSRLLKSMGKQVRLCAGVLSGTSADAAEAAVCRIEGSGADVRLELLSHVSTPFGRELTSRILSARDVEAVTLLGVELGERFADAVLAAIRDAGLTAEQLDVVGSHGQTLVHLPSPPHAHGATLQIGEASVIAQRTGIPTLSDFRTRDMAAGGQGAPLIPYFDWAILRSPGSWRGLLNLGGIANVSVVGTRLEDTVAFDTGPGNMLLDGLARRATGGTLACDLDGTLSAQGQVLAPVLQGLLGHPFLAQPPPRSTGREAFGEALVEAVWRQAPDRPFDLIATALAFTVEATARALEEYVLPRFTLEAVYLSGGGGRNPNLFRQLEARLPVPLCPLSELGFPEAAKEAACFALLASEWLCQHPQNVPSATGAAHAVILGKMSP